MDNEGHLKIIDFGTAKYINANKPTETIEKKKETEDPNVVIDPAFTREFEHRATFVGTPQYVSPEMLEYGDCAGSGDLWALGTSSTLERKIFNPYLCSQAVLSIIWLLENCPLLLRRKPSSSRK